jgi:microcystin-dependent protein
MWTTNTAPTDWLICDGAAVSRTTYATLFALVGTTYGVGNNSTTFNLPNLKGSVAVGRDSAQTEFDALGEVGGSKTSVAPHTHGIDHDHASFATTDGAGSHSHSLLYAGGSFTFSGASTTGGNVNWFLGNSAFGGAITVGSGGGHNHTIDVPNFTGTSGAASAAATSGNLQPYTVLNYIIKAL